LGAAAPEGGAVPEGAEEDVGGEVDVPLLLLLLAPTTPPMTAARIMIIKMSTRSTQKNRRRRPNIFFSEALDVVLVAGASTVDTAELRVGCLEGNSLPSASAMNVFSASAYRSVVSLTLVSN
jgi:hypothetical protein